MSCWGVLAGSNRRLIHKGKKNSAQILHVGLSFTFPALLFPQPKSREEKSSDGGAVVCHSLIFSSQPSFGLTRASHFNNRALFQFKQVSWPHVIWYLLWATLCPRLVRTHKCSATPQPYLVANSTSSHGHQRISVTAKIAGMWSYAWQLHWLLKRGHFFLGFLGTSACCLLLLFPTNSFNSFQHHFPRLYSLILSLTCHSTL